MPSSSPGAIRAPTLSVAVPSRGLAGERGATALLAISVFVLLFAYYLLKTAREPLILAHPQGPELKAYAGGAQAVALLVLVPLVDRLAAVTSRLLYGVLGFFLATLLLFALGAALGWPIGFAFYVWLGVLNVSAVALFWGFANERFSRADGERAFPAIGVGMTAGGFAGSFLAARLFDASESPALVLLVAAALLALHLALYAALLPRNPSTSAARTARRDSTARRSLPRESITCDSITGDSVHGDSRVAHERVTSDSTDRDSRSVEALDRDSRARTTLASESPRPFEGARLLLRDSYLRGVAFLLVLLNLASTTGEYVLGRRVVDELTGGDAAAIGAFYGDFYFGVNVAALALQLFVAPRVVRRFGLAGALVAMPLLAALSFGSLALGLPTLLFVWLQGATKSADYSLVNTGRALLWLPTSRTAKYAAKHTADTLVVRLGDLLSAGLVFVGTSLSLGIAGFSTIGVGVALVWLVVVLRLGRRYRAMA
jgi:AAA family ATP:ADP antiporter